MNRIPPRSGYLLSVLHVPQQRRLTMIVSEIIQPLKSKVVGQNGGASLDTCTELRHFIGSRDMSIQIPRSANFCIV